MGSPYLEILLIVVAYIAGSIPFGLVLYRVFRGGDIRRVGSRNIGATNVARSGGAAVGILTLAADILKGYLPVALCFWVGLQPDSWAIAAAALAAMIGHMFPIWLLFKGGKGVATGFGVFLGLAWHAALLALLAFVLCALVTRTVSTSSMLAAVAFVVLAFALGPWLGITLNLQIGALLGALLIIAKHHENIRRLLRGEEKRFSLGGSKNKREAT